MKQSMECQVGLVYHEESKTKLQATPPFFLAHRLCSRIMPAKVKEALTVSTPECMCNLH